MENKTTVVSDAKPATTTATAKKPVVIEQKYHLVGNERKGGYHPLPTKLRAETTSAGQIGSQFVNNTGAIARGLSTDQERYFASKLINKNPKDQGFDEAMTMYWADFTVSVPKTGGVKLNANYTVQEVKLDGETVEIQIPENLHEYIKANFVKQSSRVAFTTEQKASLDLYDFILNDLSIEKREEDTMFKLKLEANKNYIDLISKSTEKDHAKVDWVLDLLKEPTELFYNSDYIDKCKRLDELKETKPATFVKVYNDNNLESKSLLFRLKQSAVVTVEGKAIFFGDEVIGSTDEEAILYLKDQTKSGMVNKMKAQLNEIVKVRVV
jgi:hypothetical protein